MRSYLDIRRLFRNDVRGPRVNNYILPSVTYRYPQTRQNCVTSGMLYKHIYTKQNKSYSYNLEIKKVPFTSPTETPGKGVDDYLRCSY